MMREKFFREFTAANSSYTRVLLIGVTADQVISALEKNIYLIPEDHILGGEEEKVGDITTVSFVIFGKMPDIIYWLTKKLNCRGYADTDWDATYTVCADKGEDTTDYKAQWYDGSPCLREEGDCFDAFVTITDPTGAKFETGAGAVPYDIMQYYRGIVERRAA